METLIKTLIVLTTLRLIGVLYCFALNRYPINIPKTHAIGMLTLISSAACIAWGLITLNQ